MAFKRSAVRSRLSPPSYHRKRRKPLKPYGFNGFSVVCKQSFLCFPVRLIFGAKALNQKDRKMKKIKMNHSATMTEPFDDGLSLLHGERPFLMPYGLSSPPRHHLFMSMRPQATTGRFRFQKRWQTPFTSACPRWGSLCPRSAQACMQHHGLAALLHGWTNAIHNHSTSR